MIRKAQSLGLLLGMLLVWQALPLLASTVSVGTCQPGLPHFATIQAAINASAQGGTVVVCPGTYPEQISIFHPLTLRGVDVNGSNMAVITMPPGGIGNQVYVQATGVNISDLVIDGSNNGATGCGQGPTGILYVDGSGVINHVALRNQAPSGPGLLGCFDGIGVAVESFTFAANVTIENSTIHSFQFEGIDAFARGTNVTIKGNSIGGIAAGPGGNGIRLDFGGTGTVTGNSVVNVIEPVTYPNFNGAGFGILVQCSQGVTITGNTVADTQAGIVADSTFCATSGNNSGNGDSNTISGNKVFQTHLFDAIYVCGNFNLVQSNLIDSASQGGINIDSSCTTPGVSGFFNDVHSNTVNEACTTVLQDPSVLGSNTVGSNIAFNVVHDSLSGTIPLAGGTCSGAPASGIPQEARNSQRFRPPVLLH
jgi:hypothetical protein